jgi:hypothetical protein
MEILLIIAASIIGFVLGLFLIKNKYTKSISELEANLLVLKSEKQNKVNELAELQTTLKKLDIDFDEKVGEINQLKTSITVSETTSKLLTEQAVNQSKEIADLKKQNDEAKESLSKEQISSSQYEQSSNTYKNAVNTHEKTIQEMKPDIENLKSFKVELSTKLANSEDNLKNLQDDIDLKTRKHEQDINKIQNENTELSKQLASLKEAEPIRIQEYDRKLATLNQSFENQRAEEKRIRESKEAEVQAKAQELKETWSRHEKEVEDKMKLMCQQEGIEYIDKEKYPFSGKPDNCIKICDEYIIFDSKSPQGEDLSNLPTYIRTQAEQAKKYSKQAEVKKDIFLVVPTNSISVIKETFINLGQYNVHVITPESIRPILIQLKKIEDYEFAEQLSPEDRSQIAKVIGRMAHGMKRSVQVSQFLNKEFISILLEAEKLPTEVLTESQVVEGKLKLNPPFESRNKSIKMDTLIDESTNMSAKLTGQAIYFGDDLSVIETLPLHLETKKS